MARNAPAITPETLTMLQMDVKKKKPRKFFLVYKGSQIKSLVVFKKGPFGPKIMKAKKDGHIGDICFGVVVGTGEKLRFMVPKTSEVAAAMKVDGWETEPPVEKVKLKKFMKENGYPCKPDFEMVHSTEHAPDPEAEDQDSDASAASAAGEKLNAALGALSPRIKQAIMADPASKSDILQRAADIKTRIAAEDYRVAATQLKEYQSFLLARLGQAAALSDLLPLWQDAKDDVDQQLERFRAALLKTGDPYLAKIAQGGVETFVVGPGQQFVTLQTSLLELRNATDETRRQIARKLLGDIKSYQKYVASNQFIKVCDTNRICGPLDIGNTLATALSQLEQSATELAA